MTRAERKVPEGPWLPTIDDDWYVRAASPSGVVEISNTRTGHCALLGSDRIHHFEHEPYRDWNGNTHGLLLLHAKLVISGNEIRYLPRALRAH